MELANLIVVTDEQVTQSRAQATIEVLSHRPIIREVPKPVLARSGRHLDVDGILARSLPKVAGIL